MGKRTPAQKQRREAGGKGWAGPRGEVLSICLHCRPRGLDPKAAPMSTCPPRGAEQDGEQAGSEREAGREDRASPSPSSTRCCLLVLGRAGRRPRVPGALGGQGVVQQRQGAVSPMLSPPRLLRALLQTVPSLPVVSNSHLITLPLTSKPDLPPELSSGTEGDPLPEPPWPMSYLGCQVSSPRSLPPSRSPTSSGELEEEANAQATLSTSAHAGHLSSPVPSLSHADMHPCPPTRAHRTRPATHGAPQADSCISPGWSAASDTSGFRTPSD